MEVDGLPPFNRASFKFPKLSKFYFGFFSTWENLMSLGLEYYCDSKEW